MSRETLKATMESAKSSRDGVFSGAEGDAAPISLLKTAYSKNITIEEWNQLAVDMDVVLRELSADSALLATVYSMTSQLCDDVDDYYDFKKLVTDAVDKKLDKSGGMITGDLRIWVNGTENASFYTVDQFLTKPTTIRADGNNDSASFLIENGKPINKFFGTNKFIDGGNAEFCCPIRIDYGSYISFRDGFALHISWYNQWENTSSTVASYRKNDTSFYTPVIFEKGATSSASPTVDASLTNKKYVDDSIASAVSTKADLVDGLVPSTQLPSFVDDVIEYSGEVSGADFLEKILATPINTTVWIGATHEEAGDAYFRKFAINHTGAQDGLGIFSPEPGKIYVNLTNMNTYRWGGTSLVEISKSLALGETHSTAYAGDKGKANAEAIASLRASKFDKAGGTITGATKVMVQGEKNVSFENGHNDFFGENNFKGAVNCDGQIHLPSGVNPTDGNCAVNKKYVDNSVTAAMYSQPVYIMLNGKTYKFDYAEHRTDSSVKCTAWVYREWLDGAFVENGSKIVDIKQDEKTCVQLEHKKIKIALTTVGNQWGALNKGTSPVLYLAYQTPPEGAGHSIADGRGKLLYGTFDIYTTELAAKLNNYPERYNMLNGTGFYYLQLCNSGYTQYLSPYVVELDDEYSGSLYMAGLTARVLFE